MGEPPKSTRMTGDTFAARTATVFDTPLCITSYRRLSRFCYSTQIRPENGTVAVGFTDLNVLFLRKMDTGFRGVTDAAIDHFVPDGASLRLLLSRKGVPLEENISGPAFLRHCCIRSPGAVRHFLLGGTADELANLVSALRRVNSRLTIAGSHHGEFTPGEEEAVVSEIAGSKADIVWILLPTPQQENFLRRWKSRLGCKMSVLIGAGFDFHHPIGPSERREWRASTPWFRRVRIVTRRTLRRTLHIQRFFWFLRAMARELHPASPSHELTSWTAGARFLWLTRKRTRGSVSRLGHRFRNWMRGFNKRALDVAGASILVLLLSPVLLAAAITIILVDGRPISFSQRRVGKDGRIFRLYKFRTMRRDAELIESKAQDYKVEEGGQFFKEPDDERIVRFRKTLLQYSRTTKYPRDPRIMRFGRIIRKYSVDELPQLFHIIRGEMSLVGPRPFATYEVAEYGPRHLLRHRVKPGLTGPWQISDRNKLTFEESIDLDLRYIAEQSLWLDLKILLLTVPAAFKNRGGE